MNYDQGEGSIGNNERQGWFDNLVYLVHLYSFSLVWILDLEGLIDKDFGLDKSRFRMYTVKRECP